MTVFLVLKKAFQMLTCEYVGIIGKILRLRLFHVLLSKMVSFKFRGRKLKYFCHKYNTTYTNERIIEIPVILDLMQNHTNHRILEIGNVLSHYIDVDHDILDKYEKGARVINEDIVSFKPRMKYDSVVCISTLEHIGWDENPEDTIRIYIHGENPETVLKNIEPKKIENTIEKIKTFLNDNGEIIFTFPTGYNPYLDEMIETKRIQFDTMYCMKRISWCNIWKEDSYHNVKKLKYNERFPRANGLIVGIIKLEK